MAETTKLPRWRPFRALTSGKSDPMGQMEDEMDRMFGHFFREWSAPRLGFLTGRNGEMVPSLDLSETDETVQIVLDVPGMKEKDIDVTVNEHSLSVKGHRQSETEEKKASYSRIERSFGEFQRTISLPCEIDQDHVDAQLKDGVLTVTLHKSAKAMEKEKKIPIKAD